MLGHVSGVAGGIILFPVTSLTWHVITSYPELSSHTRRRMGRQPGQRQPPESRSVTVCGHTAHHWSEYPPGHKDEDQVLFALYYDARFTSICQQSPHPFSVDSYSSINRGDRRGKRENKDICDTLVVLLMHCDTWLGGNSGWVACDSSESGLTRCL